MSYGYCHTTQLVAQIDAGGTLALLPGTFLPRTFGEAVWAAGATTTTLVPSMMTMLARAPDRKLADLASLRTIVFGGAPIRADILDNLRVRLPRAELIQTYGQTEAGPRITTLRADAAQMRPGSVGRAIPGMRIEIRSTENGESLPPCQTGEVVVCGDGVMSGYFDDAAATAEVLRDGWLHTGDLGWLDDAGFLWLSGRMRNLIITAGLNVVAEEIEAHLRQVPGVADAAVFGEPDELRGESIHAVIVRLGGAAPTERDVRTFLGPRMQPHKLPRRISFVSELPKTSNGKVDRVGLARLRIGGNDDR
jgi:acyl-CoA synthetase (AMP-forming)/AMP-acid ligase II